jgi:hypothetical protein
MNERATKDAKVERIKDGWRLGIQKGDSSSYRDAQLDDYSQLRRSRFPHQSLNLSLRARTSSSSPAGTWGFGLWNDPFGLSLGFGGSPFRLPALPNAVWFFYGSKENYLSFKSPSTTGFDTPSKNTRVTQPSTQGEVANGFMAQVFRSPKFHPLLVPAGLALPFSPLRETTRKLLSKVIVEDSVSVSVDVTQWHRYKLEWEAKRVAWHVDDALVFESLVSPNQPLGVIIWIDNQYAAFTPEGKIGFGVLENPERPLLAALGHVRQERHLAGALDRDGDLALVAAARAADPPGADLPLLGDVPPQLADVLVVDLLDLALAEEARLAPAARERGRALPAASVGLARRLSC